MGSGYIDRRIAALEQTVLDLYEEAPFGCHSVAADGTYQHINALELAWLGYPRDKLIGIKKPSDFLTPASQAKLAAHMAVSGIFGFAELDLELLGNDGTPRPISLSFNGLRNVDGTVHPPRTVSFDISMDRREAKRQRMAALAFESLSGMCITDAEGRILIVNQAFTRITGYSASEACGQTMKLLSSGYHNTLFYREMWSQLATHRSWQGEIRNRRKDGQVMVEWLQIAAIAAPDGSVAQYVGTFYDITAHKVAEDQISHMAYFDLLTQLPNRRLLNERLAHAVATAQRSGLDGAMLFIDLDRFKTLNDTRGHEAGDKLLIEVARRILAVVHEADSVARLGGDEFVVLLDPPDNVGMTAAQEAEQVARQILAALAKPYVFDDFEFHCSASVGICLFGPDACANELLQHADMAMYQAKKKGGNSLCFFDPLTQETLNARTAIDQALRNAVIREEFRLFFQPQVNVLGQVVAAEALLRWFPLGKPAVSPSQFIPLAEETGLIVPIGKWVLEAACAQLKAWQDQPRLKHLQLAVNVSALQFEQPDFTAQVALALKSSGAAPALIKLEITESMVLDVDNVIAKMNELRTLGVRFSMDDFGTGHSSLSSLTRLPLDQLKIDQSFVQHMVQRPTDAVIVRTIIAMANSLGLEVIAEGVETEEQRAFLELNGCLMFQGFLFGKPMERADFETLFDTPARIPPTT
jgi:diguanylate cyclase (GGDEF)-like protein/PAS domain S-box-containing protein